MAGGNPMSNVPTDRKYSRDHEWIRSDGNGRAKVGITDFAQKQLGDIVFCDLPKIGTLYEAEQPFGTVESVKSVSDLFLPVTGKIVAINEDLDSDPELVNSDPYDDGWFIEVQVTNPKDLDKLMSAAEYEKFLAE
jgi:glycine cleavage system H protein